MREFGRHVYRDINTQHILIALLGFLVLFLTLGIRTSIGVYIDPWQQDFRVTRSQISLVSSLNLCIYGISLPFMGKLADSVGPRRILTIGIALTGAGLVGTALARSMVELYLFYGMVASLGFAAASNVVTSVAALRWFPGRIGFVQGFMITGMAAGQMVLAPISLYLVELLQWRNTSLLFGLLYLFLVSPFLFLFFKDAPKDQSSSVVTREAPARGVGKVAWKAVVRHPASWLIVLAYFVCGYTDLGFIQTHFIPFVQGLHVSSALTAVLLSIYAGSNIIGTLLVGYFTDRLRLTYILAGLYAIRMVALLFLLLGILHPFAFLTFAVLFGFTDFATISPTATLCTKIFGRENIGSLFGAFSVSHQIGAMVGSLVPGLLFDEFQNYTFAVFLAIGLLVVSISAMAILRSYAGE